MLQNCTAAQLQKLLRHRAAQPVTEASGRDNGPVSSVLTHRNSLLFFIGQGRILDNLIKDFAILDHTQLFAGALLNRFQALF